MAAAHAGKGFEGSRGPRSWEDGQIGQCKVRHRQRREGLGCRRQTDRQMEAAVPLQKAFDVGVQVSASHMDRRTGRQADRQAPLEKRSMAVWRSRPETLPSMRSTGKSRSFM
jgi:hypothetical protein